MPTGNDNGIENAYIADENGNVIWKISNVETVTMAVTDEDAQPISIPRSFSFSAKWKADRTNRKSFCRELVKLGYSKNDAKAVARAIKGNYGQHLAMIRFCGKEYAEKLIGGKT